MKKMSCNQLGGACDIEFFGESFEEIANQSKQHGTEMFKKGDVSHIEAMNELQNRMKEPGDFTKWFESKKEEFNHLTTI